MNIALQNYDPESHRLALLEQYNPAEHLATWCAFNKRTNLTEVVKFYPANWRLYELQLRYPEAHYDIDIIHMDVERDFCIIRAKLYIGDCYETSPKRAIAHKQGKLTMLDRLETGAKARAARDFGIGTEHALDVDDGQIDGQVVASSTIVEEEATEPIEDSNDEKPKQLPEPTSASTQTQQQVLPANVQPMKPKAQPAPQESKILPGQFNALKSLYLRLGEDIPKDLGTWTYSIAAATIAGLQAKLKQAS